MQTLIIFTYKLIKTFFVIPLIILDLFCKNIIQTTKDLLNAFSFNILDLLSPFFQIFSIAKVISLVKFSIKFMFILILIIINSFLVGTLVYYNLMLPQPISHELKFIFSHDAENLVTELNFICDRNTIENCREIDHINYQILLNLDVSNSYLSYSDSENIEIEMKLYSKAKEYSLKRIFFFDKLDNFSEILTKIILTPLRILGFYNSKEKEIVMIDNYDNYNTPLRKVDFIITNKNLRINKSVINLIPKIGFIRRFFSNIKLIATPIVFCMSVILQVTVYLILLFIKRRKTNPIN